MAYVTNDMSGVVKQHWADAVEDRLELTLTAMDFAEMVDIPNWVTRNIPRIKMRSTGDYTKYTDQTISPVDTGSEQITINTTPMVNFAIDPIDEQDNYINIKPEVVADASYKLKERLDGDFFNQALNAKWKYDANGFGRNAGTLTPIALVTGASQNYSSTFANAKAGLASTGVNGNNLMLGVDPFVPAGLMTVGMETLGTVASESFERGFKWGFGGMKVYDVSTLTSTTTLDLATNPTAGDFIYIKGIKFTFVATPTNPGDVDIGASADATAQNLVLAVNGTGTPGTSTYIEVDEEDRARLEGVTATDGTDLVTFVSKRGALFASSSMTAAANDFQAQTINAILMERGAIKLAMRWVFMEDRKETKNLAVNTFIYCRYGLKVTTRGSERMCVIAIQNLPAES
jgi:hypothetical protein